MSNTNYMDFFEQTSKAILFEKFAEFDQNGDPLPNLARLLGKGKVDKGQFLKETTETLGVRSFREFLDKFTPWVYEKIEAGEDEESVEIKYYLEKPDHYDETGMNPTALDATAIYEMVNKLYEQRKSSGVPQLNFDFDDVTKILSPESQTAKIKKIRTDIQYYMNEYYRLEEKTPGVPSSEKQKAIQMVNENRLAAQQSYTTGTSAMLTLKLGDAGKMLLEMQNSPVTSNGEGGKSYIGLPEYDAEGNLCIKKLEYENEESPKQLGMDTNQKLLEILQKDYEDSAPDGMKKSPEITNLVLSNFSTALARSQHDKAFWLDRLEKGQRDYKKWMENLANTIAPLIEKFIGVKAFFENATTNGKLDSYLIIANSTASDLVDTDTVRGNLQKFLSSVNREVKQRIWFGIIPAVSLGNEDSSELPEYDPDDPFGSLGTIGKTSKPKKAELVSPGDAKLLLDACEEAGIMTFYNFKADSKTCFEGIDEDTYEKMRDAINFEKGEHAVCCLPNFTIIPEQQRNVIINKELRDAKCQDNYVSLQIPSIYVEASYVAAGMVIGSQQKDLLIKKDFNINPNFTNIRFDLESKDVYKKFQSNMCVENTLPVPRDMNEEIMNTRFGFYFSDKKILGNDGKEITHCYVKNARTMAKNSTTNKYEEMTNRLFMDFVNARLYGNDDLAKPEDVGEFLRKNIQEWKDHAQEAQQTGDLEDNALLKPNESIESTNNVDIVFNFEHAKNMTRLKLKAN